MENKTEGKPEWSNPMPAGLVALAVACFGFFALLTGQVDKSAMLLLGCFLLGGFVVQILVALIDLKTGNNSGGNTFMYFSAYFMLASGIEMIFKYFNPGLDTRIDGWAWLALFLVVVLWTPAFFKTPALMFILVCVLDVAVACIVVADLKLFAADVSGVFSQIAGYSLLICGLLGVYMSASIILNTAYGKTILPNPKSFYKGK